MTLTAWTFVILAIINVIAFAAFGWDKATARNHTRRIPEAHLLTLAFLGGALGALLGQQAFRHKTQKQPFRSLLIAAACLNLAVAAIGIVPEWRRIALGLIS